MLTTIIGKEIRDLISSTTFAITFGVCAVLILLSFYVGASSYRLAVEQHRASQAEDMRQLEGLTDWFSVEQHRIFLPPQPLEALVSGISNDIGRTAEVRTRGEIMAQNSRFNEDPIYAAFRFLDLEFVFQIVLSLFAVMLGYNAISGEKETGTLRLVFANPVPRATYIIGKLVGSFVALVTSLILAIGLGCLLLPTLGVHLSGDEWLRLGMIIVAGLMFFGVFLTASVFVSAITQRSSNSFVVLLVFWIATVLIIPRASVLLAGRAIDVPSVDQIEAQKATYSRDLWKDYRQGLNDYKTPQTNNPEDIEAIMTEFHGYMDSLTAVRDRKMSDFASRVNETRANRQTIQKRAAFGLARLSPAASFALAAMRLSGTDVDLKDRFYEAANDYRDKYNAFITEKTGMNVAGRVVMFKIGDDEEEPEPIDPGELPGFQFQNTSFGKAAAASVGDLGVLALFNLIFFAGAFVGFLRYDLR